MRKKVLFPAPERPMMATKSPWGMETFTSESARVPSGKTLLGFLTVIMFPRLPQKGPQGVLGARRVKASLVLDGDAPGLTHHVVIAILGRDHGVDAVEVLEQGALGRLATLDGGGDSLGQVGVFAEEVLGHGEGVGLMPRLTRAARGKT